MYILKTSISHLIISGSHTLSNTNLAKKAIAPNQTTTPNALHSPSHTLKSLADE
ncbi:hypothetical protein B6N60_03451 [Richelia sinica FACHB-800]|uniref:Uncharacterized protein n=1 Tax=Richelia sinica FACHB-800 TaxID=1357546 RepID=A0A975TB26_9NOST|nr:hypothetical protein [Richelia sinica]MBD2666956.1 hypothetical protein [Richelia sinica FACHB-800]QXE24743.1 hypothetical protein B6N60_03451 [Richelia sinica FACHB-800]